MPERKDDFAWENDHIAFRIYGQRLEDELVSSGVDIWCKRTRSLIVDRWYKLNNYHKDKGEGLDCYTVGPARGCGGTAIFKEGKLYASRNFTKSRIIASGPIRFIFELTYELWEAGGMKVAETKRITLDAGQNLNRFDCTFTTEPSTAELPVAIGLQQHGQVQTVIQREDGWMRVWESTADKTAGKLGVGLVIDPGGGAEDERDSRSRARRGSRGQREAGRFLRRSRLGKERRFSHRGIVGRIFVAVRPARAFADARFNFKTVVLTMRIHTGTDRVGLARLDSAELRQAYLIENLFVPGSVELAYVDLDRAVIGGAVPTTGRLQLKAPPELRSTHFAERRELGVLNLGGSGAITVDGTRHSMDARDALYVGKGSQQIEFESEEPSEPARFYLVSHPAHAVFPTRHAAFEEAQPVRLGNQREANERTIYKYIHKDGIQSCQLVMGFTELKEGSVWNSVPPHTHQRRTEIYLYFGLPPEACVMHFMGTPTETRHLVVRNEQAVLSPGWSIHCGAGTQHYCFAWAMGGENQEFTDMDAVQMADLR